MRDGDLGNHDVRLGLGAFLSLQDLDGRDVQIARLLAIGAGPALSHQMIARRDLGCGQLGDDIVLFLFEGFGQCADFGSGQRDRTLLSVQQLQSSQNGVSIDEPAV